MDWVGTSQRSPRGNLRTCSRWVSPSDEKQERHADCDKPFWASVAVYLLGLTVIKCSVILQLLRFMVDPKVRKLCLVLLALVCTHGLAVSIASICSCVPVAYFWDKTIEGGHCMNLMVFWYCNSSFNIITDLVVIAIPISVLRSLQIPKRQKYCLVGVFALGGL